jgi:Ca-activated chloride channel homolog
MRLRLFVGFVVCSFHVLGQNAASFRADVNLVNVSAVVKSKDGKLFRDLSKADFEVFEDGTAQTLQFFARKTDLPLSLGLIVDASGSQEHFLKQHDNDIHTFLKEILRPTDQAFVVCFGNHLRLVSDFSNATDEIMGNLRRYAKGETDFAEIGPKETRDLGTALYDAVYFSSVEKMSQAREQRRAFIVFTDGEENSSEHDLLDAISAAQDSNTLVYCIRYTHKEHGRLTPRNRYGMRALRHMADETGATDFDGTARDLKDVFDSIGEELRSMYDIGYVSSNDPNDNKFRKISIRTKNPEAVVRAKSGYYPRANSTLSR